MMIPRRAHEWAADRFRFVQYPRERRTFAGKGPDFIDKLFKLGLFGWLMAIIWGGALIWAAVIAFVLIW
jgi:hypothetical protein